MSSGPISTADIVLCSVPYAAWVEWGPPSATCFPWSVALTVAQGLESTLSSQNVPTSPLSREASHKTDVCRPSADAVPRPSQGPYPPSCHLEKGLLGLARGFLHTQRRGTEGPSWVLACWLGTTCSVPCGEVNRPPELPVFWLQLLSTALGMWWSKALFSLILDCQKERASGSSVWRSGCLHLTKE